MAQKGANHRRRADLLSSSRRLITLAVFLAGIVVYLPAISSSQEGEVTKQHVIVTYDISGSLGPRFIEQSAHERIKRYLDAIMTKGWTSGPGEGNDTVIVAPDETILSGAILKEGTSWEIFTFGISVVQIKDLEVYTRDVGAFDGMYPRTFADRETRYDLMLDKVCNISLSEYAAGSRILWVYVSDDQPEMNEKNPAWADTVTILRSHYDWRPLFSLKVWRGEGKIYENSDSTYLQVLSITPRSSNVETILDVRDQIFTTSSLDVLNELAERIQKLEEELIRTKNLTDEMKIRLDELQAQISKRRGHINELLRLRGEIDSATSPQRLDELEKELNCIEADLKKKKELTGEMQTLVNDLRSEIKKKREDGGGPDLWPIIWLVLILIAVGTSMFFLIRAFQPVWVELARSELDEVSNPEVFQLRASGELSRIYLSEVENANSYEIDAPDHYVGRVPSLFGFFLYEGGRRGERIQYGVPFEVQREPDDVITLILRQASIAEEEDKVDQEDEFTLGSKEEEDLEWT